MIACCQVNSYRGTAQKRVCRGCGRVEIGVARRIYYNIETHGLDGVVCGEDQTVEQMRARGFR